MRLRSSSRLSGSVALALACAATLAGCPPDAPELFWDEEFESTCDGTPCGWLVGAGPVGSVTWVETLPGEHGIAMFGDRIAVLGPTEGVESDVTRDAANVIAYLAARRSYLALLVAAALHACASTATAIIAASARKDG